MQGIYLIIKNLELWEHNLRFYLHKRSFNNLSVIPRYCSFLCHLYCFGSFSSNKQYIWFLGHDECCSDSIFTWGYNPEFLSFFTIDAVGNITDYSNGIFSIGIIIGKNDNLWEIINNFSHLWPLCFISISCCSEYRDNSFSSFNLSESFEYISQWVFRVCIINIYFCSSEIWDLFETTWNRLEVFDNFLYFGNFYLLRYKYRNSTENISDIKVSLKRWTQVKVVRRHANIQFSCSFCMNYVLCSNLCARRKTYSHHIVYNNIFGEKSRSIFIVDIYDSYFSELLTNTVFVEILKQEYLSIYIIFHCSMEIKVILGNSGYHSNIEP